MMALKSNFMPTYPKYEYIFFSFQIKVGSVAGFFSSAEPDPDPREKFGSSSLANTHNTDDLSLTLTTSSLDFESSL